MEIQAWLVIFQGVLLFATLAALLRVEKKDVELRSAAMAYDKAVEALIAVEAMKRSTHQVQFLPLDQMLGRNKAATETMEKALNPGNEDFDFDDALLNPEQLAEKYMPNARLRNSL